MNLPGKGTAVSNSRPDLELLDVGIIGRCGVGFGVEDGRYEVREG